MNNHSKTAGERGLIDSQSNSLSLYIVSAILARIATGGAAIAVILLARSIGADGKMAGVFAACLTAPHVLGPLYGKWLDKAQKPLLTIALACILFTCTFQLVLLSINWNILWLTIGFLLICGSCSSFMMGGLSTQLSLFVDTNKTARRRAQSWDNASYGIGLTLGPLLVGLLTTHYSISFSISFLMSIPLLAAFLIVHLSGAVTQLKEAQSKEALSKEALSKEALSKNRPKTVPGIVDVVAIIAVSKALKRTLIMTASAAFAVAALPVLAVYFSEAMLQQKEGGAWLVTLYGIGSLLGSVLLIINPMKGEALTLLRNVGMFLLLSLVLLLFSESFNVLLAFYGLCGLVNAAYFAATLAARTEYAPAESAAQIYMWVAAAKITAASLGAFVSGLVVDFSTTIPLLISAAVLGSSLLICFWRNKKV